MLQRVAANWRSPDRLELVRGLSFAIPRIVRAPWAPFHRIVRVANEKKGAQPHENFASCFHARGKTGSLENQNRGQWKEGHLVEQ
jgi:hypothetical protein